MTPEEIEPRVSDALRLMQLQIDDRAWCPRENVDIDRVFLMLLSKAFRAGLAIGELVKSGFYGEAFGLARTILETYFSIKYIAKPSKAEERAKSYIAFGKAHLYNREMIRQKYFPAVPPPVYMTQTFLDETKRQFADTHKWIPASNMAEDYYDHPAELDPKTGKGFQAKADYESTYEVMSQYVHARIAAIHLTHEAQVGDVFKMAKVDKEGKQGFLSLFYAVTYAYLSYVIVARNWNQGPSNDTRIRFDALFVELQTLVTAASGGDVFWKA